MIVRILWIQTEADLRLQAYMKVVLRMATTTSTVLPIATNTTIRTSYSIMIHISLYGHENLLKHLQSHSHTQILLKPLKSLHHF